MRGRIVVRYFAIALLLSTAMQGQIHDSDNLYPAPLQRFDPLHQRDIVYHARGVEISLRTGTPDALALTKGGRTSVIALPYELAQVNSITGGVGGLIVVNGMVNGSGSEIVLVDPKRAKITDLFFCYLPAIDPSGRWIAFIKFYPTHSAIGIDHYMIYDLLKSAKDNRPTGTTLNDRVNVGEPVYPKGVLNEPGDNVDKPSDVQHQSASRLFWSADGDLVFGDRIRTSLSIIWIKVRDDGSAPEVKRLPLDTSSVCSNGTARGTKECVVLVTEVLVNHIPVPSMTARLTVVGRKTERVTYSYSEFHRSR